jgi:UTP:GlnB (protein PII) uridylyltransferase
MISSKVGIPYRIEKTNVPYHTLTFESPWRKLPNALDRIRSLQLDVRKALITPKQTTLFIKESQNRSLTKEKRQLLETLLNYPESLMAYDSIDSNELLIYTNVDYSRFELPNETQIMLYNLPEQPFTVCEFTCKDRIGLLSDILTFLSVLPVDIQLGHISTVNDQAHNAFHLVHIETNKPLTNEDVMYVSNVFEYEGKERAIKFISPEY